MCSMTACATGRVTAAVGKAAVNAANIYSNAGTCELCNAGRKRIFENCCPAAGCGTPDAACDGVASPMANAAACTGVTATATGACVYHAAGSAAGLRTIGQTWVAGAQGTKVAINDDAVAESAACESDGICAKATYEIEAAGAYKASANAGEKGYVANLGTADHTCVACPAGKRAALDSTRGATGATNPGLAGCAAVPCGLHMTFGANYQCAKCAAGKFRYDVSAAGGGAFTRLAVASTQTGAVPTAAEIAGGACISTCPKNHHLTDGVCTACAAGKVREAGDAICSDASAAVPVCAAKEGVAHGTTAGSAGVSANTACRAVKCAADHFVNAAHKCVKCAAGKTNAAGDDASGAATTCAQATCLKDQYVLATGTHREVLTCTNCVAGYTMGTLQAVTTANSKDANGVSWTASVTPCHATVCKENYHVDGANKCGTLRLDYTGTCYLRLCIPPLTC
jgi:hypothetical protein